MAPNLSAAVFCGLLAIGTTLVLTAEPDDAPPRSVKQLMKEGFVRPETSGRKAFKGVATKEELAQLLAISVELSRNRPPKGTAEAWQSRTEELVVALRAGVDGEDGAIDRIRIAVRCVDCHRDHRPVSIP